MTYDELPPKLADAVRKANDAQARHDAISEQMHDLGKKLREAAAELIPARRNLNALLAKVTSQ